MAYGNGNPSGYDRPVGGEGMPAQGRLPQIVEQMNGLDQRVEGLGTLLSELEARLAPILMPEGPTTAGKDGITATLPVPLGASLAQANARLTHGLNRLQALMTRIEL